MDILICEGHRLFAEALMEALTSNGHQVVGNTADPEDAVTVAAETTIDLCIIDVAGTEGVTDQHIGELLGTGTRLLLLTDGAEVDVMIPDVPAGAVAVAAPNAGLEQVLDAAERLHDGVHRVGGRAPARAGTGEWTAADMGRFLTRRELEVLECLARGQSTQDLARALGVHPATARTHIQNVLAKLCVHSRVEAVAFAIEHQLIRYPA